MLITKRFLVLNGFAFFFMLACGPAQSQEVVWLGPNSPDPESAMDEGDPCARQSCEQVEGTILEIEPRRLKLKPYPYKPQLPNVGERAYIHCPGPGVSYPVKGKWYVTELHYDYVIVEPKNSNPDSARIGCFFKVLTPRATNRVNLLQSHAQRGDVEAQFRAARAYQNGEDVAQDYEKSLFWYKKAAEQGYAAALNDVGMHYANGWSVKEDMAEAFRWISKSAEKGYAEAKSNLAVMKIRGSGTPQNVSEGITELRALADQGVTLGQWALGITLYQGEFVTKDSAEGIRWIKKAALGGRKEAADWLTSHEIHTWQ